LCLKKYPPSVSPSLSPPKRLALHHDRTTLAWYPMTTQHMINTA
jgi:hypothetical protein